MILRETSILPLKDLRDSLLALVLLPGFHRKQHGRSLPQLDSASQSASPCHNSVDQ